MVKRQIHQVAGSLSPLSLKIMEIFRRNGLATAWRLSYKANKKPSLGEFDKAIGCKWA